MVSLGTNAQIITTMDVESRVILHTEIDDENS